MIAEPGGTRKVTGKRIATPLTDPRPGIAPIKRPSVTPIRISSRFRGWMATSIPSPSRDRISMACLSPSCQLALSGSVNDVVKHVEDRVGKSQPRWHADLHQPLKEEEQPERKQQHHRHGQTPAVLAEQLDIVEHEDRDGPVHRHDVDK